MLRFGFFQHAGFFFFYFFFMQCSALEILQVIKLTSRNKEIEYHDYTLILKYTAENVYKEGGLILLILFITEYRYKFLIPVKLCLFLIEICS